MDEFSRRFTDPQCWDASLVMGVIYTMIYGGFLGIILLAPVPTANQTTVDILAGAMTIIQTNIVQYFFGSSKNAESTQRLIAQSKEKTDTALRELVVAAAPSAAPVNAEAISTDTMNVNATGPVTVNEDAKK